MFFAVMAYFSFSILDAVQKTAIIYHSVFQLLFIKYCFVLLLSLIESKRKKNLKFYVTGNFKIQILRSILSIIESGLFVLSFKYLTLANAHSIAALAPLFVWYMYSVYFRIMLWMGQITAGYLALGICKLCSCYPKIMLFQLPIMLCSYA